MAVLSVLTVPTFLTAVGTIGLLYIVNFFYHYEWPIRSLPQVGRQERGLLSLFSSHSTKLFYRANNVSVLTSGLRDYPNRAFQITNHSGPKAILPATKQFLDFFKNDLRFDFSKAIQRQLFSAYPGFEPFHAGQENDILVTTVRTKLSQSLAKVTPVLAQEAAMTIPYVFGTDTKGWKTTVFRQDATRLIAVLSARIFLGPQLAHNPQWVRISIEYTVDAFMAARELRRWPAFTRPLVHWFLPVCKKLRAEVKQAAAMIAPIINERRQAIKNGDKAERLDTVQWFEDVAEGRDYNPHISQLALGVASIHTTSALLTHCMYDLVVHQELIQELREEIAIAVKEEGGWTKTALYKMKLLDSVMKESQRMSPGGVVLMNRILLEDVVLPDGARLPKGTMTGVPLLGMRDPSVFSDPDTYDGHRFVKLRVQEGDENKWQFVTTSPEHLGFGHGMHACPGRFFASNETKIAIAYLVMCYDWRLPEGQTERPRNMRIEDEIIPDPRARLECRRRERSEMELEL